MEDMNTEEMKQVALEKYADIQRIKKYGQEELEYQEKRKDAKWRKVESMNFKRLTMIEKSTGKSTVLYDGAEFKNFDYLKSLVGSEYANLNDDLMDGICESNNFETTRTHYIYKYGECVETLTFEYEQ